MAQPKNRQRRGEETKEKSAARLELENLQKKADAIVQKRNDFNQQASAARAERDLLNEKRKQLVGQMEDVKKERDAFNAKLREHKALRDDFQAQAKELIAQRRARFSKEKPREGEQKRSPVLRARELQREIEDMEFRQQTEVLTTHDENELLKQLRLKRHEYDQIKKEAEKAAKIKIDVSDTDKAIDALFAKAEEHHQQMLAVYKSSQEAHERFVKLLNEAGTVSAEANKHHQHFIEMRQKADEQHNQFLELREKMLELKGRDVADRREAREIIREQARKVRDAVANPEKLATYADDALEQLKKGGKIKLG